MWCLHRGFRFHKLRAPTWKKCAPLLVLECSSPPGFDSVAEAYVLKYNFLIFLVFLKKWLFSFLISWLWNFLRKNSSILCRLAFSAGLPTWGFRPQIWEIWFFWNGFGVDFFRLYVLFGVENFRSFMLCLGFSRALLFTVWFFSTLSLGFSSHDDLAALVRQTIKHS